MPIHHRRIRRASRSPSRSPSRRRQSKQVSELLNKRSRKAELNKVLRVIIYFILCLQSCLRRYYKALHEPVMFLAGVAVVILDFLLILLFTAGRLAWFCLQTTFLAICQEGRRRQADHQKGTTPVPRITPKRCNTSISTEAGSPQRSTWMEMLESARSSLPNITHDISQQLGGVSNIVRQRVERGLAGERADERRSTSARPQPSTSKDKEKEDGEHRGPIRRFSDAVGDLARSVGQTADDFKQQEEAALAAWQAEEERGDTDDGELEETGEEEGEATA